MAVMLSARLMAHRAQTLTLVLAALLFADRADAVAVMFPAPLFACRADTFMAVIPAKLVVVGHGRILISIGRRLHLLVKSSIAACVNRNAELEQKAAKLVNQPLTLTHGIDLPRDAEVVGAPLLSLATIASVVPYIRQRTRREIERH